MISNDTLTANSVQVNTMTVLSTLNVSTINASSVNIDSIYYSVSLSTDVITSGSYTVLGSMDLIPGTWLVSLAMNIGGVNPTDSIYIVVLPVQTWYEINDVTSERINVQMYTISSGTRAITNASNVRIYNGNKIVHCNTSFSVTASLFFTEYYGNSFRIYPEYTTFNAVKLG